MWNQVGHTLNESTVNILSRLAALLPGMLALLIAVLVSIAVAVVVASVLRRFLRGMQFDKQLEVWGFTGVTEFSPAQSPTLLVTRAVAAIIVLLGFALGLSAFDATLTSELALRLFNYLPDVVTAIVVILVGSIVARYLARAVLIESVNMNLHYARFLSLGVKWLVMVFTIAMALNHLEIGSGIVSLAFGILFGGIVLALALAVGLAVGLGSRALVSRSLDHSTKPTVDTEEPIRHI